ncbi:TetR/AcrR family transcriptional regulator [Streptomyces sp. WA6-1-16]|uniref:TetR/AcrR family transcriptional regulator n=1 Tax=Streptomyces sp. WA6-1-16 TaxID=2879427 RepID=UPI001CE3776D|nr:helix-turn-helix domain-containing protein [Streptomyces sp. WA6-1-16]UCA50635.1 TetR/AcrR family transcriptional regulator [Streptomyces sp. WA6-1-16]
MTERSWGGTKLADRRATRRQTLLDVAERLAGEEGCAAVTVRSVCREARLTDRYFYESFTSRDDLLLAAFERVADEARIALEGAVATGGPQREVRARAAVSAFVALVLDAPHKGRLLLLEPFADPVLGARSHLLMPAFTDLVGGQLAGTGDGIDRRLAAHALVGGLANLFAGWLHGTLDVPRERLEAHCVELVLTATTSAPAPAPGK